MIEVVLHGSRVISSDQEVSVPPEAPTMIGGVMSDRETDRHARVVLRQATALGRFDAQRAFELGVIDAAELAEVTGA